MGDKYEEDEEDVEMDFGEECDNTEESDVDVDVQIEEGMGEEDDDDEEGSGDEEEEWGQENEGKGEDLVKEDDGEPTAELGEGVAGEGSDDEGQQEVPVALLCERMSLIFFLGCRRRGHCGYYGAWWPRRYWR